MHPLHFPSPRCVSVSSLPVPHPAPPLAVYKRCPPQGSRGFPAGRPRECFVIVAGNPALRAAPNLQGGKALSSNARHRLCPRASLSCTSPSCLMCSCLPPSSLQRPRLGAPKPRKALPGAHLPRRFSRLHNLEPSPPSCVAAYLDGLGAQKPRYI